MEHGKRAAEIDAVFSNAKSSVLRGQKFVELFAADAPNR
jgi:hypothetical protein